MAITDKLAWHNPVIVFDASWDKIPKDIAKCINATMEEKTQFKSIYFDITGCKHLN